MESATVQRVAQILKLMKPPMAASKQSERGPGLFELSFRGMTGENDGRYFVQLPPEYDPLRHYPAIVALADAGVTPEQLLDYWAGPAANVPIPSREGQGEGAEGDPNRPNGERLGQATRHGYIVIAVDWQLPHQLAYDYSAREHHAVLGALRDACRRFAIDTDRVFLTGHGIGGDAAWDIALAHPDLWAGVIPFVARAGRYVERYAKNAPYLNWYIVAGELDGDKMARNAQELDRYMKPNNDVTVVEYLGRGFEPFGDEIQRLFDWMGRRRRTMPRRSTAYRCARGTTSSGGSRSRACRKNRWYRRATGRRARSAAGTRARQTIGSEQGLGLAASGAGHGVAVAGAGGFRPAAGGRSEQPRDLAARPCRAARPQRAFGRRADAGRQAAPVLGESLDAIESRAES